MAEEPKPVNEEDFKLLKERMNLIVSADPAQYHNDYSLRRYLRAFKSVDSTFQVFIIRGNYTVYRIYTLLTTLKIYFIIK